MLDSHPLAACRWTLAGALVLGACSDDDEPNPGDDAADDGDDDDDDDDETGEGGGSTGDGGACVDETDPDLAGEARPLESFEFRNAFDPSDRGVYVPGDELPGPVMVDTWGDRSSGPHGTLGVFPPGFAAPPHVHTHGYYGVVLTGEMSNPFGTDLEPLLDAEADGEHGATRLGPGSLWHVPAGSQHTTTCVGPDPCLFYFHAEDLFDFTPLVTPRGGLDPDVTLEAPHPDAILLPAEDLNFAGEEGSFVQFAPGWGSMAEGEHGSFGEFLAGAASPPHIHAEDYYGVVISGEMSNPFNAEPAPPALGNGGYWSVPADSAHVTACDGAEPCRLYFHSRGAFDFEPLCE